MLAYSGDTTKSFLYVQDSDEELSDWEARVVLADGTDDVIMVDSDLDHGDRAAVNFDDEDKVEWATEAADLNAFPNWVDSTELDKWDTVRGKITDIDYQIWEYETNADGDLYTLIGRNTRYAADVEINNGKAYMQSERWTSNVSIDNSTIFVDVENNVVYTGYDEVPDVSNAYIAYVLENDNSRDIAEIVYIIDGDIYDANAIFFVLESADRDTEKYDGDFYFEFEDTKVDGHDRDGLFVSYDALINSGYLDGINSLDEDDSTADRDSKVTAEIEDELVGKIIEVRKSTDGTYVTEIRVHDDWDPAIAVSRTALDVAEDWFFGDNWNTSKYTADADTTYVIIEEQYNRAMTERTGYDVSEGGYGDIVAWANEEPTTDRDGYTTLVNVVKDDDQNAQLVYIYRFMPEFYYREVTITLNGEVIDEQYAWWFDNTIVPDGEAQIALANAVLHEGDTLSYYYNSDVNNVKALAMAGADAYTFTDVPTGLGDVVINVTTSNIYILTNGNVTLSTVKAENMKPISVRQVGNYFDYTFQYVPPIMPLADGADALTATVEYTETITVTDVNGYSYTLPATDKSAAMDVNNGYVQNSTSAVVNATDKVLIEISNVQVILEEPEEPVYETAKLTLRGALLNDRPVYDADDTTAALSGENGLYEDVYTVKEGTTVIIDAKDSVFTANDVIRVNGKDIGYVNAQGDLVVTINEDTILDADVASDVAVTLYAVQMGNGITLIDANGNEYTDDANLPAGTYTVKTDTGYWFSKNDPSKLGEFYATDATIKDVDPDDASTYTLNISKATAVYAGVKITSNDPTAIEMYYVDADDQKVAMTPGADDVLYMAYGEDMVLVNDNTNQGVVNVTDGAVFSEDVNNDPITVTEAMSVDSGFVITLGNGVTATLNGKPVEKTTLAVKSTVTIDKLGLDVDDAIGTDIIVDQPLNMPYSSTNIDPTALVSTIKGETLVAATKVDFSDLVTADGGVVLEYINKSTATDDGTSKITDADSDNIVYVENGTTLVITLSSVGHQVTVNGSNADQTGDKANVLVENEALDIA